MSDHLDAGQDRTHRRLRGRDRGWVVALILIAIGVILLLENLGFVAPPNWWAVLLLIPAAGGFASAWRTYNREGRPTVASAGPFIGGVALVVLAIIFLLDLKMNWDLIGPIALILLGLGLLARTYRRL